MWFFARSREATLYNLFLLCIELALELFQYSKQGPKQFSPVIGTTWPARPDPAPLAPNTELGPHLPGCSASRIFAWVIIPFANKLSPGSCFRINSLVPRQDTVYTAIKSACGSDPHRKYVVKTQVAIVMIPIGIHRWWSPIPLLAQLPFCLALSPAPTHRAKKVPR